MERATVSISHQPSTINDKPWIRLEKPFGTVRVLPELADVLAGSGGLRIDAWRCEGSATIVKAGRHRTVYRVALPQGTFFAKHFHAAGWTARLPDLVRPCKAERELSSIRCLAAAGIPTVEPVAVAMRRTGPLLVESWLVTRAIETAETLDEFLVRQSGAGWPHGLRQHLAERLGAFVARLHRCGLHYRDLHAGNVLVRVESNGALRLWLIDPHPLRKRRRLSTRQAAGNLAQFQHFFSTRTTPAERLRFLEAYWGHLFDRTLSRRERRARLPEIESASRRWSRRAFDKADRKWHDGHRKLIIIRREGVHCRGVAELGEDILAQVAAEPEAAGTLIPAAIDVAVQKRVWKQCDGDEPPVVDRRWLGRTRRWGRARAVWEIGHALLRRGIPTPRPLLFCEMATGGLRSEFVVTESAGTSPVSGAVVERSAFLHSAGRLLRRLHENGFLHAGLSPGVFLAGRRRGKAVIGGVESIEPVGRVSRRQVVAQLARLNSRSVRPTERLRFLLAYLGWRRRSDWKPLWRAVQRADSSPGKPTGRNPWASKGTPPALSRRRFLKTASLAAALWAGCRTSQKEHLARPARHSIRSGSMIVMSDFRLESHDPLIEDLVQLRKCVSVALDLPVQREEVVIYIFRTQREFRNYLNAAYPNLPSRRAYFVGTRDELAVYTYWGERIQEDLRHEYTHGLLHASLKAVPLWLDEGLAEYFEVAGPRPGTVNTEYAGRIAASLANGWTPNLRKLEQMEDFSQMQHIHYQEAWAWVHFLLHHSDQSRQILLGYLNDLRTHRRPASLSERLRRDLPGFEQQFVAYVAGLQTPQLLPAAFERSGGVHVPTAAPFPH